MLNVYLNVKQELQSKIISINDAHFNNNIDKIDFHKAEIVDIMKTIDGATYTENGFYKSKYNNQIISVSNLSTGCKTLINIISFSELIFDISECGKNAFDYIFEKINRGNIYIRFGFLPKNIYNTISMIIDTKKYTVKNLKEFENILDFYFGEGN